MKKSFLSMILACAALVGCAEKNPVLTVEGGQLQGVETSEKGVIVYKGVPYAAAPVGDFRWKEPQPVTPWEGVKVADTFGAPNWQNKHTPGGYTPEFFFDGDPEFSEDCLYLNVWTPAAGKENKKLPVCLWIHGGGYTAGWGHEPEMDGVEWAKHGVVLVTFNYRLGLLGFMTHPALSEESAHGVSGNYGMLDQIAALKWVKNNIAQFGGDPDKITIMGQSAGAMSVQTLITSPLSKDLIAGAIIQSGGGISNRALLGGTPLAVSEEAGKELMDWAGCTTLEQMRAIPAEELLTISTRYMMENHKMLRAGTSPVVDGYALPKTFGEAAVAGEISNVPYLIGCTSGDMAGLNTGILRFCQEREKSGKNAYAYLFDRPLPTDGRENVLQGAFHSSELWYTFKTLQYCWRPFTEADYELAEDMITSWTNFVKFGDPNGAKPGIWTPCTTAVPMSMAFCLDEDGKVASAMKPTE